MVKKEYSFNNPTFVPDETAAGSNGFKRDVKPSTLNHVEKGQKNLTKDQKFFKLGIIKNVLVISFGFTCLFTSFNSMANLQSSINKKLGTTSLWVVYAGLVFSCAFLPTYLIKKFKVKWTLAISMLAYSTYMAAQFYPRYYTLIPTAIILGLGAAPMWSAKCTYLTQVGKVYGDLVGEKSEVIITRFFGIFFLFFQSSQVIGNFISSTVLSSGVDSVERSEEFLTNCGSNYCPSFASQLTPTTENATRTPEEEQKITLMSGIYLACALASAVIISVFVDSLSKYGEDERDSGNERTGLQLLMATFKHLKKPYQILIIPLTFWSGIEQAFIGADFTAAFVTCGLGVHMVGYVMICYGVCDALFSFGFSPLVKLVGRVPIFILGTIINVCILVSMFYWRPHPDAKILYFIVAGLWGIADAIWQTQINAFYGVIFPDTSEAAFSNYRLWESLGFIVAYALSSNICINIKIYMNLGILAVGMTGYLVIEMWERTKSRNK